MLQVGNRAHQKWEVVGMSPVPPTAPPHPGHRLPEVLESTDLKVALPTKWANFT